MNRLRQYGRVGQSAISCYITEQVPGSLQSTFRSIIFDCGHVFPAEFNGPNKQGGQALVIDSSCIAMVGAS